MQKVDAIVDENLDAAKLDASLGRKPNTKLGAKLDTQTGTKLCAKIGANI